MNAREEAEALALKVLGITPGQLNTGQAVSLCGHVYVSRDNLQRDDYARSMGVTHAMEGAAEPFASSDAQLLESPSGVFVPVPAGCMLSVTVTPYDATPEDDSTT